MKRYVLLAGVNGAGKSTLFSLLSSLNTIKKINFDEIVRGIGDWKNSKDIVRAGKISIDLISEYFSQGISFSQETTLCGKSVLQNIEKAKSLGYSIEMHYVGLDSVDIAKERIENRVKQGGHGISDKDVERRYLESFTNLRNVLEKCDLVAFYDNTEVFRRFAIYKNGKCVRLSSRIPNWYEKYVL